MLLLLLEKEYQQSLSNKYNKDLEKINHSFNKDFGKKLLVQGKYISLQ